jgi:hypothetical protein
MFEYWFIVCSREEICCLCREEDVRVQVVVRNCTSSRHNIVDVESYH